MRVDCVGLREQGWMSEFRPDICFAIAASTVRANLQIAHTFVGFQRFDQLQALVVSEVLETIWRIRAFFCLQGTLPTDEV